MKCATLCSGFTLIELLLALALGAFVIASSVALYQNIQLAYTESSRQLQSTQKFAVAQRIVDAAVNGALASCNTATTRRSLVNGRQFWSQAGRANAEVYPASSTVRGLKRIGSSTGARAANSDVLLLRTAQLPASAVVMHDIDNDKFVIQNSIGLSRGELAVVCDKNAALIFQVSHTTGRHIHYGERHGGRRVAPGNCTNFAAPRCGGNYRFAAGALLARYTPLVFYVGYGYAGVALYRQKPSVSKRANGHRLSLRAQELVSGIAQLRAALSAANNGAATALAVQLTIADGTTTDDRPRAAWSNESDSALHRRHDEKYLYTRPL